MQFFVGNYLFGWLCGREMLQASTFEGKLEHGFDAFMGGMGFVPVVGTGI